MADERGDAGGPRLESISDNQMRDRIGKIIGELESEAQKRVNDRVLVEQRWLRNLRQYHGEYEPELQRRLEKSEQSRLFVNLTRAKTDAMSAKLSDLLLPTDDRNWGIKPTPVPELTITARRAFEAERKLTMQLKDAREEMEMEEAAAQQSGGQIDPEKAAAAKQIQEMAQRAKMAADELRAQTEIARERSDLMQMEIEDQLKACRYNAAIRDMIDVACKIGTGVVKGPVTGDMVRHGWKADQSGAYGLQMSSGDRPAFRWVDTWGFFPSMSARQIEDSRGVFERHLMTRSAIKRLARLDGFSKDALRYLLQSDPRTGDVPSYLALLRNITKENQTITDMYSVWEYTGPLEAEQMRDLAIAMNDQDTFNEVADVDPLDEIHAVVWFCQGQVLKFSIYPMDSNECMYSVFNLVKDETSIFGYGIPEIIAHPQSALNGGWRAMMDNAGLAAGPQIVVAKKQLTPQDGTWRLYPRKVWEAEGGIPKENAPFATFNIPMNQVEMANIIALSEKFIDDQSALPAVAQGEGGPDQTKTFKGLALLDNNANVGFRRIVRNFDDDVTVPNLRRAYDWNMQFNPKQDIKGDYEVDARGSSVLLVREMQAQNLMFMALNLGGHPVYGPMLRNRELLKKLFQAHLIPADEVVLTDDEIDAVLARAAANNEQMKFERDRMEFERQKLEGEIAMANMDNDAKIKIALIQHETELIKLAQTGNYQQDKLEAMMEESREARRSQERIARQKLESEERRFAAEAAMTEKTGKTAGGSV